MKLFGYTISKKPLDTEEKDLKTFSSVESNDGTIEVESGVNFASLSKYVLNLDSEFESERQRIDAYRNAARLVDLSTAIDEITNDAIVTSGDLVVNIVLDKTKFSDNIKTKIIEEFEYVLGLLNFNNNGDEIFKRWYIDGKIYYHKVVGKSEKDGIVEVRYLDPRRIKKVRESVKGDDGTIVGSKEYYVYSLEDINKDNNYQVILNGGSKALEIHPDMIAYAHSGLVIEGTSQVDSYLQKALKPLNQLTNLEDSLVVYRVSRAPERRIFYIDVGNLPKTRAEGYIQSIIRKYKNKITYDASTGSFTNNKNQMSMLEDIWLPRREGSRGTEVSTLPGGQSLGELDDVEYFRKKLWRALHMPLSRMASDAQFNIGRSSEITRDEVKFGKFINKLQHQFGGLLLDILKTQLILKKIITEQDWKNNKYNITLQFNSDDYFTELKKTEVLNERLHALESIDPFVGKYFSPQYVMKNVLQMTEEDIKDLKKELKESGLSPNNGEN